MALRRYLFCKVICTSMPLRYKAEALHVMLPMLTKKCFHTHLLNTFYCHITWTRQFGKLINPGSIQTVSTLEMKSFLKSHTIEYGLGYTCFTLDCILCPHVGRKKIGTLYINRVTGMFLCHSCRLSGTWQEFQDYVTMLRRNRQLDLDKLTRKAAPDWELTNEEIQKVQNYLNNSHSLAELTEEQYNNVVRQFNLQCIRQEFASKYNLRISKDGTRLLFPVHGVDSSVVGIRTWTSKTSNEKIKESIYPKKAGSMLFGFQRITRSNKELILTASPIDTIAVTQELGLPSVSLPKGISILPQELLPALEQFSRIILWLGNNVEACEAARMFAFKLGEQRCSFIRPKERNLCPFEALKKQDSLNMILKDSHPVGHKSITSFTNLREDVLIELTQVEQVAGIKWQRFPHLNKLLKGHRRGEMTILTGPTGSGKTTFMSEYSLDLCIQGVNTLWGSFEIKNTRLAKTMLIQFSQLPLDKHLDQYDEWANKFEQLSLHFMTFHGQENFKNVLEVMSHAVYVYDIRHVVLDNLQFMMGVNSKTYDRFWLQDMIISEFRKFASINNIHLSLVIHPRKERDMEELTNTSIFGGAKASQEADNILILQDKRLSSLRGKKYIQVSKNRFDGDIGIMPLDFNKETLSFSIVSKKTKSTS